MFNEKDRRILSKYISNIDSDVFVLKNLPEVVKGALFSRYSRSSKSLKRLLLDEFINSDLDIISKEVKGYEDVNESKAEEFYDRVLLGFGDDSVAELAFAHIALENVSMIASKALEDSRIGLSPLEKSTRYVYFDKKVDGSYLYYKEPKIMESRFADEYIELMDLLFETYSSLLKKVRSYVEEKYPKTDEISERAYKSTIRAKTCDLLRGLLPASTLTNLGLAGNGRSFEYLLIKLRASPLKELNKLAEAMHSELSKVIPSFVKRSYSKHGDMWVNFLKEQREILQSKSPKGYSPNSNIKLIRVDGRVEDVVTGLFYEYSNLDYDSIIKYVNSISKEEINSLLKELLSLRKNRRHKPPRAFELISFTFEVTLNFGAYRDLQRHRIMMQMRQPLTTKLSYTLPKELEESGYSEPFKEAMEEADKFYDLISPVMKNEAQYAVPLAYNVRWLINLNLREAFHLCELRSSPQGHDDYREIAVKIYKMINSMFPNLSKMDFVNMDKIELNRLNAEIKLDRKIEEIKKKYNL